MSVSHTRDKAGREIEYPTNNVVGVVDTSDEVAALYATLTSKGFLDSEVSISCGEAMAEAFKTSTGRKGLAHMAVRIAERFGVKDEEMELKDKYEQELRDGHFVIAVLAPTEERKALAAQFLRQHGGHSVNFLGRLSIEPMKR